MKEDLSKAIYLLDNITQNMEWIKLLLEKDRIIAPLTTYDLVMRRLGQVKEIIESNLTDEKMMEKIKMGYVGDQNSPLPIRDSVGTEELP